MTDTALPLSSGVAGARPEGLPRVATALAVTAWGLALTGTALLVAARPRVDEGLLFFLVDTCVAMVYGTVAAVVLSRRRHVVGWLLALAAVGGGLSALGFGYKVLDLARGPLPAAEVIGALQSTAWPPGTFALFLVVPWLVRDHPLRGAWAGVLAGAVLTFCLSVAAILGVERGFTGLITAAVVLGLVAAAEAEWRHRRGPVGERNGLGWLALGAATLAISFVPLVLPYDAVPLPFWTTPVLHLASQAVFPAAILVAVLRGRMWDLGLVVSRAVLAGLMTVALLAVYLVVVLLMTWVVPGDGLAQLVGAGVVAVAVQPVRLRLTTRVEHLVYGAAADPAVVVRRLGSHLGGADSDALLTGLLESLATSMRLESARLTSPSLPPTTWGTPVSAPTAVPLVHRGEEVGTLEVTLPAGEALGARERRTLAELSPVLATALAVTLAGHEVARAEERLAHARLEERRVIRREIHDGLGPSLAGLRLGLQGARNLLATDPVAAGDLLTALQDELDQRVQDVRSLSHHLLPPALEELGLAAALEELAARHREDGLAVTVFTQGLGRLRPELAAAAYGIIGEAVVNVGRHSGATHCWIDVRRADGTLTLTVADDGRGIDRGAVAGVGTQAMRERAEEQGGTCVFEDREGGGAVVAARMPVEVTP